MPDIEDYAVYNDRMRRSMWDKAFFMDKIPGASLVVDYGCADGSLIRFLSDLFPSMRFIGFDIDGAMIAAAREAAREGAWFFSDPEDVTEKIRELGVPPEQIAVNFSSVFHEVFHYGFDTAVIRKLLHDTRPRYIVVRDMMYVSEDDGAVTPPAVLRRIRSLLPDWQIASFEAAHGPIGIRRNLTHLLLKFHYTENWDRECAENYFSYGMEELMAVIDPQHAFRRLYLARYTLPWIRCDAETALGVDPGDGAATHFALILGRRPDENTLTMDS